MGQTLPAPLPKTVKTESPVSGHSLLIENEDDKEPTLLMSAGLDKVKRLIIKVSGHNTEATFEDFALNSGFCPTTICLYWNCRRD